MRSVIYWRSFKIIYRIPSLLLFSCGRNFLDFIPFLTSIPMPLPIAWCWFELEGQLRAQSYLSRNSSGSLDWHRWDSTIQIMSGSDVSTTW